MQNKPRPERTVQEDEVEIDLLQLFFALKKRLLWIIGAVIVFGGLSFSFSKFILTPQYTSTAMVYVLSKETTLASLADLQIGSQLTSDYKIIVVSRPVLKEAAERLNLDLSYEQMVSKIEIDNPTSTRILSITAKDPDPVLAKELADAVASISSDYIGTIMEMVPPKIIEEGVVAETQSSPSNTKNALIGALIGALLVCAWTVVEELMNDSIQTEEDVARYLELTVLASLPARAESAYNGAADDAKKKSAGKSGSSGKSSDSGKSRKRREKAR